MDLGSFYDHQETEPKAKIYIGVIADELEKADEQVAKIKEDVLARVNQIIA